MTLWSTVVLTDAGEIISKEFKNIERWLLHIQSLPVILKSLKKIKLERGIPAIVAISTVSWFPMNSYSGAEKSSNSQTTNKVSFEIQYSLATIKKLPKSTRKSSLISLMLVKH